MTRGPVQSPQSSLADKIRDSLAVITADCDQLPTAAQLQPDMRLDAFKQIAADVEECLRNRTCEDMNVISHLRAVKRSCSVLGRKVENGKISANKASKLKNQLLKDIHGLVESPPDVHRDENARPRVAKKTSEKQFQPPARASTASANRQISRPNHSSMRNLHRGQWAAGPDAPSVAKPRQGLTRSASSAIRVGTSGQVPEADRETTTVPVNLWIPPEAGREPSPQKTRQFANEKTRSREATREASQAREACERERKETEDQKMTAILPTLAALQEKCVRAEAALAAVQERCRMLEQTAAMERESAQSMKEALDECKSTHAQELAHVKEEASRNTAKQESWLAEREALLETQAKLNSDLGRVYNAVVISEENENKLRDEIARLQLEVDSLRKPAPRQRTF